MRPDFTWDQIFISDTHGHLKPKLETIIYMKIVCINDRTSLLRYYLRIKSTNWNPKIVVSSSGLQWPCVFGLKICSQGKPGLKWPLVSRSWSQKNVFLNVWSQVFGFKIWSQFLVSKTGLKWSLNSSVWFQKNWSQVMSSLKFLVSSVWSQKLVSGDIWSQQLISTDVWSQKLVLSDICCQKWSQVTSSLKFLV